MKRAGILCILALLLFIRSGTGAAAAGEDAVNISNEDVSAFIGVEGAYLGGMELEGLMTGDAYLYTPPLTAGEHAQMVEDLVGAFAQCGFLQDSYYDETDNSLSFLLISEWEYVYLLSYPEDGELYAVFGAEIAGQIAAQQNGMTVTVDGTTHVLGLSESRYTSDAGGLIVATFTETNAIGAVSLSLTLMLPASISQGSRLSRGGSALESISGMYTVQMCVYGSKQTCYFSQTYDIAIDSLLSSGSVYEVAGTFSGTLYASDLTTYDPFAVSSATLEDGTFQFAFR